MLPPIPLSRTTSPTRRCNLKPLRTTCVVIPKSAGRRCSCDLPNLGHHRSLPGSLGNGCNGCMDLMMPNDSMFLFIESREHPMHVGGLSLFEPPQELVLSSSVSSPSVWLPTTNSSPCSESTLRRSGWNRPCGMGL